LKSLAQNKTSLYSNAYQSLRGTKYIMTKPQFPFVIDYKLFERVDVREAQEILDEFNDFFLYNQSQYNDVFRKISIPEEEDDKVKEQMKLTAEKNAKAATDHFGALWGKDFAESCFCGLKISWYDLQQILLEEFRSKTPATASKMNKIASGLRRVASTLLFAEYLQSKVKTFYKHTNSEKPADLEKVRVHNEAVDAGLRRITLWFPEILARLAEGSDCPLPEYNKSKNQLAKLKNIEAVLEFCYQNLNIKDFCNQ